VRGARAPEVQITVIVNEAPVTREVEPRLLLIHFLRDDLGLTGTKHGCELGECSTCGVLVDGKPFLSCLSMPLAAPAPRAGSHKSSLRILDG